MAPSKPAPALQRPDGDEQPPASAEELRVIRDRMKTFEEDRRAARPVDEVMERLLRRHPAP
jgi:hypothetical protein